MERIEKSKLGMARLWRDPYIKKLVLLLVAAIFVAIALLWIYGLYSTERLKQSWLDKESAMIGSIASTRPELANEWVRLLSDSGQPTVQELESGRKLLEEYGITSELEARWLPAIEHYRSHTLWTLISGTVLGFAILAYFLLRHARRQLFDIRNLAVALDDTVKHNQPMKFRIYGEGELGLLANGVQELSLRLKETIGQLNQDKDFMKETVADISHQLKTPLASLMIYIDLLREGNIDSQHSKEFLDTCKRELDRMEWLTLTLLKIARLEADALEMSLKSASLLATVTSAIETIQRLAAEKGITIEIEHSDESLSLYQDSHWLAEAIANVLKNAVEHSPEKSRITVTWERTPVFIRLRIIDRGFGIEEQHLPHIFKKFYRVSGGGHGVGLGLPLSKSIVERHGGMLTAAPNPKGGTIMTMTLPLNPLPIESPLTNL